MNTVWLCKHRVKFAIVGVLMFSLGLATCKKEPRRLSDYEISELKRELERRKTGAPPSESESITTAQTTDIVQTLNDKEIVAEKVVHGIDHRLDWFEIQDPTIRTETDSVAAIFDMADVTENVKLCFLPGIVLGNAKNLCSSERYILQPAGAKCSAFVVGSDIIATAGHCINESDKSQKLFVFGYRMTKFGEVPLAINKSETYKAKSIIGWHYVQPQRNQTDNFELDYALVQTDRPIDNHVPLPLRRTGELSEGVGVYALGYPSGLPIKFSGVGPVTKISKDGSFVAPVDTFGGNSGSPVINVSTHEVEGVLVRGDPDFKQQGTCQVARDCPTTGCKIGEQSTLISAFTNMIPTSPTKENPPPLQAPFVKVFSSGPKVSGNGKDFSDWYTVEAEPPPPGYKIVKVDYSLTGDRKCNAWSVCRLSENTQTKATLQFKLQGHDEWPSPGQATSEGHLIVTYGPAKL